jgi:hypothetical protein
MLGERIGSTPWAIRKGVWPVDVGGGIGEAGMGGRATVDETAVEEGAVPSEGVAVDKEVGVGHTGAAAASVEG